MDYQASAGGARSSIAAHKPEVPALRYDNLNPNGKNLVRFDGLEGNTLIDRKFSITSKSKQLEDLRRMSRALSQNPEYLGRIEVPTQAIANRAKKILENLGIQNIDVKVVVP